MDLHPEFAWTVPAPTGTAAPIVQPAGPVGWKLRPEKVGLAGVGLTCDDLPIYRGPSRVPAGTVISRKRVTRPLILAAGNITIQKSCLQPQEVWQGQPFIASLDISTGRTPAEQVILRDNDCDGTKLDPYDAAMSMCFQGVGVIERNYVHHFGSGIALMGTGTKLDATIVGNYVTDMVAWGDGATTGNHESALTVRDFAAPAGSGRHLEIDRNYLDCDGDNCTGALFFQTFSGNIDNVSIRGNLLMGQGWQLILQDQSGSSYGNMRAVNNRITGTGWGATYVRGGPGWTAWAKNYRYRASAPGGRGALIREPRP